jgi:hypothetical protein
MTEANAKNAPSAAKKAVHASNATDVAPKADVEAKAAAPAADVPKKKGSANKAPKANAAVKAAPAKAEPAAAKADAAPAKAANGTKATRAKKEKVVRDSFTMPKSDYQKIAALKQKCLAAGVSVKKSEILRAGLLMLESAAEKRLLAAVAAVEQVKTGRPTKA